LSFFDIFFFTRNAPCILSKDTGHFEHFYEIKYDKIQKVMLV